MVGKVDLRDCGQGRGGPVELKLDRYKLDRYKLDRYKLDRYIL